MTAPKLDGRISLGNIISLVGTLLTAGAMVVAMASWGARQDQRMVQSERRIDQNAAAIAASEVRIRSLELQAGRQDEKLTLILQDIRDVKALLQLPGTPRPAR